MKQLEVAAAIFIANGHVFAAQRGNTGEVALKWEFPGGKLESEETGEQAIVREIQEEFNTTIQVKEFLMTVSYQYKTFHLTMHAFLCSILEGTLQLTEHVDAKWLTLEELDMVDWAEADKPIVEKLRRIL